MRLPFADVEEPLRAFWQARFYDFNVYSKGNEDGEVEHLHACPQSGQHARESGDSAISEISERLGVGQLGVLLRRKWTARS
jgi:hypothetical protein